MDEGTCVFFALLCIVVLRAHFARQALTHPFLVLLYRPAMLS